MKTGASFVLLAAATIYAAISATVATSVIIMVEGLGYRISLASALTYTVIMVSDITILVVSASRMSRIFGQVQEIVEMASKSERQSGRSEHGPVPDLNDKQQLVVHAIERMGGAAMQNSLSDETGISPPTLSRVISSLEKVGVVEKKRKGMTNEIRLVKK